MSETRRTLSLLWSQEVEANALMGRLTAGEIAPFGPEFKAWRDQTTKLIFRHYPENGREAQEWTKVFFPRRVYSGREDSIRMEDCREVLAHCISFLDEICRKLKDKMHGEAIVLAEEALDPFLMAETQPPGASPAQSAPIPGRGPLLERAPPAIIPESVLDELINEVTLGYIPLQQHMKEGALHQLMVLRDELAQPYPSWEIVRSGLLWLSGTKTLFLRALPEVIRRSDRLAD